MDASPVSKMEVLKNLDFLSRTKGVGPDRLYLSFLKNDDDVLTVGLTKLRSVLTRAETPED